MVKPEKIKKVEELKKLAENHKAIGVVDLSKLPGKAQFKIKNELKKRGVAIKMARKAILARALKESPKHLDGLEPFLKGSPAIIFSDEDAFRLFSLIKKNKSTTPAKAGDVVVKDVIVKKGPTGISPGPAITTLGKVGLKTRVEAGKISIVDDKTVAKAGTAITDDIAAVLGMLKIEPVEIMMHVAAMWDSGTVYTRDILDVDPEAYLRQIESAVQAAVNLSLDAGYLTSFTAPLAIQKAFWQARGLAYYANILEKEFIGDVLAKAAAQSKALEEKILK